MEMQIGDGAYAPVSETTFSVAELIDSLPSGSSLEIHVRKTATETAPASAVKAFTLYSRGARPSTLIYNSATNSLSGCSTSMQYRLDTATSWTAISGTTLNLQSYASADRDVKVYVRTKATNTAAASLPVEVITPQKVSTAIDFTDYSDIPTDTGTTAFDVTIPEDMECDFGGYVHTESMVSDATTTEDAGYDLGVM